MAKKKKKSSPLRPLLLLLIVFAGAAAWVAFRPVTQPGKGGNFLYIPTGGTYASVVDSLEVRGFLQNTVLFSWAAKAVGYPTRVRPGRYRVEPGTSLFLLLRTLRAARQEPVKLVINKLRSKTDFSRLVATNLEVDSASFGKLLADSTYLAAFALDTAGALGAAVPATYEIYWNTTADEVFKKIVAARTDFWTEARKRKAGAAGLTPAEVTSLAAIVDEETNKADERGTIASVYLNRLRNGMKLQADPTARWAGGDFSIKRITSAQTSLAHPYNTYYVKGLPPGPITTPTRETMDAVLDAPNTDYLYFCAREDFSGYHRFAASYDQHLKNARVYQAALNSRGIK